eukprot:5306529-Amphidinium_carterae.2
MHHSSSCLNCRTHSRRVGGGINRREGGIPNFAAIAWCYLTNRLAVFVRRFGALGYENLALCRRKFCSLKCYSRSFSQPDVAELGLDSLRELLGLCSSANAARKCSESRHKGNVVSQYTMLVSQCEVMRSLVCDSLNVPAPWYQGECFQEIGEEPVAAASLGQPSYSGCRTRRHSMIGVGSQVYRARLLNGAELPGLGELINERLPDQVAVKVQRPGAASTIALDMFVARKAAAFLAGPASSQRRCELHIPLPSDTYVGAVARFFTDRVHQQSLLESNDLALATGS